MVRKDGKVMRVALSESRGVSFAINSTLNRQSLALKHQELDGGVRTLTLERPPTRECTRPEKRTELTHCWLCALCGGLSCIPHSNTHQVLCPHS